VRAHRSRNNNQILHGDQTIDVRKIYITGSTTSLALAKNFGDTNADARSR